MKLNLWKIAVGTLVVAASGLIGFAAPLKRADVMADPSWLLHLDCDGLRPTTIGQYILGEMDKPDAKVKLAAFQAITSIDIRTQLHGVTLYGSSKAPEEGVLIAYGDFDSERLLTLAKAAKEYKSSNHKQHVIHSWIDENKKGGDDEARIYAAIVGNRAIFSQRESRVAAALDVIDGTTPNLGAGDAFPELGTPGNSHFVEAGLHKIELPDSNPGAAIVKLSKSVQLTIGEKQKQIQGTLTLVADGEDVAGNIFSIAQGLVALLKFQKEKPEVMKFANALSFKQNGSSVTGSLTLAADDVVGMMRADAARKAQAKKAEKE